MQSPHLIDARVLRGRFDNWFMRLRMDECYCPLFGSLVKENGK